MFGGGVAIVLDMLLIVLSCDAQDDTILKQILDINSLFSALFNQKT